MASSRRCAAVPRYMIAQKAPSEITESGPGLRFCGSAPACVAGLTLRRWRSCWHFQTRSDVQHETQNKMPRRCAATHPRGE